MSDSPTPYVPDLEELERLKQEWQYAESQTEKAFKTVRWLPLDAIALHPASLEFGHWKEARHFAHVAYVNALEASAEWLMARAAKVKTLERALEQIVKREAPTSNAARVARMALSGATWMPAYLSEPAEGTDVKGEED